MIKRKLFLQNLLTKFLITGTVFLIALTPISVRAEEITEDSISQTVINCDYKKTKIDMTYTKSFPAVIDPNAEGEKLTSGKGILINNSSAPVEISINNCESDNTMVYVLPWEINGVTESSTPEELKVAWYGLGARDSSSKAGLGIATTEESQFRNKVTDKVYFKTLMETGCILGSVNSGDKIEFEVFGNHGLAIKEEINTITTITYGYKLAEE